MLGWIQSRNSQPHHAGGLARSSPPLGCFLLQEKLEVRTLMNFSQAWGGQRGAVLRRPGSQHALGPPCPPAFVADVSSAPLDDEAGSGPALRPGSGCAVGVRGGGRS